MNTQQTGMPSFWWDNMMRLKQWLLLCIRNRVQNLPIFYVYEVSSGR